MLIDILARLGIRVRLVVRASRARRAAQGHDLASGRVSGGVSRVTSPVTGLEDTHWD